MTLYRYIFSTSAVDVRASDELYSSKAAASASFNAREYSTANIVESPDGSPKHVKRLLIGYEQIEVQEE